MASTGAPISQAGVCGAAAVPPAAATSASVAHLKVNGMATVTILATSISASESTTVICRSGRSDGHTYGASPLRARICSGEGLKRAVKPENTLPPAARRGRCMAVALTPADAVVDVHLHRPQISEPGQAVWR